MNPAFVPLSLSTVAPSAEPKLPAAFQPLASEPKAPPAPAAESPPPPPKQLEGAPSITVERNGTQITRIRVQCTCGEVIELECAY